jgi:hypothetical protein
MSFCPTLVCTTPAVLGLEVKQGCKVSKIATEIVDVVMWKILQSDVLNVYVGGVAYINIPYTDEVGEVFFIHFSPGFCVNFWYQWHWRGGGVRLSVLLLWEVVLVVAVVCQGI